VSATIGSERLAGFTTWASDHHVRAFLGEFGAADNPTCEAALGDLLDHINAHRDVWFGYTSWSAGPAMII
jgi:endoglucanase